MKEIGHTIYSGFCGLICEVSTICCGVRKKGKGEEGRKEGPSPGIRYV